MPFFSCRLILNLNREELSDDLFYTDEKEKAKFCTIEIPTPSGGTHAVKVKLAMGCDMKSLWDNFGLQ